LDGLGSSKFAVIAAVVATVTCAPSAGAVTYPAGFEDTPIATGLTRPTEAAWAPDGRLFVAEKDGALKVVPAGASTATTVADYSARVNSASDRGLLGLAVDGQFAQNPYLYLLYTYDLNQVGTRDSESPMVSQLLRVRIDSANQISQETVILGTYTSGVCPPARNDLDCIPADGTSHSIGTVRSASDGTLWVGNGDAAGYGGVDLTALRTYDETSMAGKLMHIDRNGMGLTGHSFCPADNNLSHVCTKLHAKGFRNPFRFTLRPGGGITLGDVGWNTREEIDLIGEGGKSYGWPCYEGTIQTPGYRDLDQCAAEYAKPPGTHVGPDHDYAHGATASVIGGPTYTAAEYPSGYRDSIFFGDYSGRFVRRLVPNGSGGYGAQGFATDWDGIAVETAPDGNLAYVTVGNFGTASGSVRKIVYSAGNASPVARIQANPTSGPAPLAVTFDGRTSSDPDGDPLSYNWDFGDGSSSSASNPAHTYAFGSYTARLTVSDGRGKSSSATATINAGNAPPVVNAIPPSSYRGGETFVIIGSASDAEDGQLPPSALDWNVRLVHGSHDHFVGAYADVAQVDVNALTDHDADSHYEAELTATDSAGASATKTISVYPETTTLRLRSSPSGAPLSYAGKQLSTPQDLTAAVGFHTTLSVPETFAQGGKIFNFASWSDGGARVHDYTVPPAGGTLTAGFTDAAGQAPGGLTPGGSEGPADRTGPTLQVTAVSSRRGRLRGSARDPSGVRLVQVALRGSRGKAGCRWWIPRLERMSVSRRSCRRPRWLAAELTATKGGARWRAKLGGSLRAGRYRVIVRAFDTKGNRSRLDSGPSTLVRVRR
jgi:glucose/arabinose dehydrogenase